MMLLVKQSQIDAVQQQASTSGVQLSDFEACAYLRAARLLGDPNLNDGDRADARAVLQWFSDLKHGHKSACWALFNAHFFVDDPEVEPRRG